MKNYLPHTLILTLLVVALLAVLSIFSKEIDLNGLTLRRMDIFADIRATPPTDSVADSNEFSPADTAWAAGDSLAAQDTIHADSITRISGEGDAYVGPPPPAVDTTFFGNVIEDYTPGGHGLGRFFSAVDSVRLRGRTVRVAWYGDSFVEGDILIGDLRDTLQTVWGGGGVGFVPITSEVAQFKRSLKHSFRGFNSFSIVKKTATHPPFGLDGHAYVPEADARVHYKGAKYFRHTRRWSQVRLFYVADQDLSFVWQNGEAPAETALLKGSGQLGLWKSPTTDFQSFTARFPEAGGLRLYGATLEDGPGIYIDNFSVRGNSGGPLKLLQPAFVQAFDRAQHYDLVVIQVGLNAVTNSLRNITWYRAELDRTFAHLRACFPGKPILVMSVGDRGGKVNGELSTMISVPAIVEMQRDLARKHGFLFYDLFRGMGGPGTMVAFSQTKPRLANTDFTHLTHEGGKVVGHMIANLFLAEQKRTRRNEE